MKLDTLRILKSAQDLRQVLVSRPSHLNSLLIQEDSNKKDVALHFNRSLILYLQYLVRLALAVNYTGNQVTFL